LRKPIEVQPRREKEVRQLSEQKRKEKGSLVTFIKREKETHWRGERLPIIHGKGGGGGHWMAFSFNGKGAVSPSLPISKKRGK